MATPIMSINDLYSDCPQKEEILADLNSLDTQYRLLIQSTTLLSQKFSDRRLMAKVKDLATLGRDGEELIKLVENAVVDLDNIKRSVNRFFNRPGWSIDTYTKSFALAESYGTWHEKWCANIAPVLDKIAAVISQAERELGETQ